MSLKNGHTGTGKFDTTYRLYHTIKEARPRGTGLIAGASIDALPFEQQQRLDLRVSIRRDACLRPCCHAASCCWGSPGFYGRAEELAGTVDFTFLIPSTRRRCLSAAIIICGQGYLDDVDAAMGLHVSLRLPAAGLVVMDSPLMKAAIIIN